MLIGIVILTYNSWNQTEQCLTALEQHSNIYTDNVRIYMIDNGSTTKMPDDISNRITNKKNYVYINTGADLGFNGGFNVGLKKAIEDECNFILITSNDIYYQNDVLSEYAYFYSNHSGLCFPKIYTLDRELSKVSKTYLDSIPSLYYERTFLKKIFRNEQFCGGLLDVTTEKITKNDLHLGPCFALDLSSARRLYPFDEGVFLYYEEYILARNAKNANVGIYYNPNVIAVHGEGKTISISPFSMICIHESSIYYARKYLKAKKIQILPLFLYFRVSFLIKAIKNKKFRDSYKEYKKRVKAVMKKSLDNGKKVVL